MADNNKTGCKLYVANLPYSAERADILTLFGSYGKLTEVHIVRDETGKSKGYGFVSYDSPESAQSALLLDGTDFGGRLIAVQVARERKHGGK